MESLKKTFVFLMCLLALGACTDVEFQVFTDVFGSFDLELIQNRTAFANGQDKVVLKLKVNAKEDFIKEGIQFTVPKLPANVSYKGCTVVDASGNFSCTFSSVSPGVKEIVLVRGDQSFPFEIRFNALIAGSLNTEVSISKRTKASVGGYQVTTSLSLGSSNQGVVNGYKYTLGRVPR